MVTKRCKKKLRLLENQFSRPVIVVLFAKVFNGRQITAFDAILPLSNIGSVDFARQEAVALPEGMFEIPTRLGCELASRITARINT